MNKNYAGKKLNGHSFRGQDLTGADFTGCELKSCDFRDANLTNTNFCRAKMGINKTWSVLKILSGLLIGCLSGLVIIMVNYLVYSSGNVMIKLYSGELANDFYVTIFCTIFALGVSISILLSLKRKAWNILYSYFIVITLVAAGAGALAGAGEGALAGVGAIAVAVAVAVAVAGVVAVTVAGVVAVAIAAGGGVAGTEAASIMSTIFILLGWYLNHRALKQDEPMLSLLRQFSLTWQCWKGTQFSGALLAHTNFSEADLRHVRITGAQFKHPSFQGTKNLCLAQTFNTPLQHPAIRRLLTEGQIEKRDFSFQHIRGLSFKGIDLSSCNFYHADLSEVDFSDCNLTNTDFSEAMVFGTVFNRADLTGAIIDNWGVDKQTQFEETVCEYIYTKRDEIERNPPNGVFQPGEFSKLYQEIANTLDFIVHSPEELQALLLAIDCIKQQGGDLVIQSLERKNESVVIRTQSHETIDKSAIYSEVKEQMALGMNMLQQENQLLELKLKQTKVHHQRESELQSDHSDLLAQLVTKAIEQNKVKIMIDHSRHISNSTVSNSALNQGDASSVNNYIEQVADNELKTTLQNLQQLLAQSALSDIDKQNGQEAINDLAAISHKPEAERKSLARRSLAFLKDLREDLSYAVEIGKQYHELIAKIMLWF